MINQRKIGILSVGSCGIIDPFLVLTGADPKADAEISGWENSPCNACGRGSLHQSSL